MRKVFLQRFLETRVQSEGNEKEEETSLGKVLRIGRVNFCKKRTDCSCFFSFFGFLFKHAFKKAVGAIANK